METRKTQQNAGGHPVFIINGSLQGKSIFVDFLRLLVSSNLADVEF